MLDGATVVLDVGKTLSKAGLWAEDGSLVAKRQRPNLGLERYGYRALDAQGIEDWLAATLREFATLADVKRIIPLSHGAGAALVRDGCLVLPPLDYEHPIPAPIRGSYQRRRDAFTLTGSPALPNGLNLGAQLFFLKTLHPQAFGARTKVLPWAQYWSWILCGVPCAEVTSLGCHTDLWYPALGRFSDLAITEGWAELLGPVRRAGEGLGTLLPSWQRRTGLPGTVTVHCGLHDSNAALLAARGFPQIAAHEATVLSTGTWFVSMRTPDVPELAPLPIGRDCLVNVDAFQRMIPSARWMGGREIELLTGTDAGRIDIESDQAALLAALGPALEQGAMVLPTLVPGTGPYPEGQGRWHSMPGDPMLRRAAVCLYAALMSDAALDLIDAKNCMLIEGRFSASDAFVRTLATLRPSTAVYTASAQNDVSYGALRLLNPTLPPSGRLNIAQTLPVDLSSYRAGWRSEAPR